MRRLATRAVLRGALIGATTTNLTGTAPNPMVAAPYARRPFGSSGDSIDSDLEAMFGCQDPGAETYGTSGPLGARMPPAVDPSSIVRFEKLNRTPSKFDVLTFSNCYIWRTTAGNARRIQGPMREWSEEVKYRTGVHLEVEPTFPEKIPLKEYKLADDVEVNVYAFGSDRAISHCAKLIDSMLKQEPSYVRLGLFRRIKDSDEVEWLTLRRVNSELRPPDIPPISLKLTGTHTMLFEGFKEAAVRTTFEETGIVVDPKRVFPTGMLFSNDPTFYWRVPVRYFVAELPEGSTIRQPLPSNTNYFLAWDARILRQSPDPIDQAWAKHADQETGSAWLRSSQLDELQKPLRGEDYMSIRYTPPPYSELQHVLNLPQLDSSNSSAPAPPTSE